MIHSFSSLLVLGNQAADLDSTVCTICQSRLLEILYPRILAVPLFRKPPEDLYLTPEIPALLNYGEIGFKDMLTDCSKKGKQLLNDSDNGLYLVDHNEPEKGIPAHKIAGIIDHHRDSGFCLDLNERLVETCGSCASLVSRQWHNLAGLPDRNSALLLAAAILIDTGDFNPEWGKTRAVDTEQYESLKKQLTPGDIRFLKDLRSVKDDLTSLSIQDFLRRDYKDMPVTGGIKSGISSVPIEIHSFFSEPFYSASPVKSHMKSKGIDLLFIMHNCQKPFRRELSFHLSGDTKNIPGFLSALLSGIKKLPAPGFRCHPLQASAPRDWFFFSQDDSKASRKVVLPHLSRMLDELLADIASLN